MTNGASGFIFGGKLMGKAETRTTYLFFAPFCLLFLSSQLLAMNYSGTYLCELSGDYNETMYMRINQEGANVQIQLSDSCNYSFGIVDGNEMEFDIGDSGAMTLVFADDGQSFSGTWLFPDENGLIHGTRVPDEDWPSPECWDINSLGVPQFVNTDYTDLNMIEEISRFRSAYGHDYSDDVESCRSMKHYYSPFAEFRDNSTIEIYSPVNGIVDSITNEQHGSSEGLTNKQIQIQSTQFPAFTFVIFHTDLISSLITEGTSVKEGQLLGHARLYYPTLNEYARSFDIAIRVNSPQGQRYVSYFETMTDTLFDEYVRRGATSRYDFIITEQERNADPIACDGEQFLSSGTIENWVILRWDSGFDFSGPHFGIADQVVDIWDLAYIVNRWLEINCEEMDFCDGVDSDHDGRVNQVDFCSFSRQWMWRGN